MTYQPKPIQTDAVKLSPELEQLMEKLARNTHENWAAGRMSQGWTWGPMRDDEKKHHPCLIPYEELSEEEKEYDRRTSGETLKVILALGYRIER